MRNYYFLCKSEISEVLNFLRCHVHCLESHLMETDLDGDKRVYCETRLDFMKSIVRKLTEAYEAAD